MRRYVCPVCGKQLEVEHIQDLPYRPFCSRRCEMIDLGRWFNEQYCIPCDPPLEPIEPDGADD